MHEYLIVLEKSDFAFSGYAPDVPGCGAVADTLEETIVLLQEALEFHVQGLVDDGEGIPLPSGAEAYRIAVEQSRGEEYFLTHIAVAIPDNKNLQAA